MIFTCPFMSKIPWACSQKSMKMYLKIDQKINIKNDEKSIENLIKFHLEFSVYFWSILQPFGDHFWRPWAPFWEVLASKRDDHPWENEFWITLHWCFGAFGGPRRDFGAILTLPGTQNGVPGAIWDGFLTPDGPKIEPVELCGMDFGVKEP